MDEEFKRKLENRRKEFGKTSDQYRAVLSFLFRYSNDKDRGLSDDLKYLFTQCDGQPIQRILYNTIIYNIPIENWEKYNKQERYRILYNCGAESYYYQEMLNKCIGRTFYDGSKQDTALLTHIRNEIIARFEFTKQDFKQMEEDGIDYAKNTFGMYTELYRNNDGPKQLLLAIDEGCFIKAIRNYFSDNKVKRHFIKDEKSFWIALTRKRTKGKANLFTNKMYDTYRRRLHPTKDDLFVFAIAVGLTYDNYEELREIATRECGDYTRYAYNDANIRDALILSVIRNIDTWYKGIEEEIENELRELNRKEEELKAKELKNQTKIIELKEVGLEGNGLRSKRDEIKKKKSGLRNSISPKCKNFSMELLFRIDEMLWDNFYIPGNPPVEMLLYHNFLLDRGCSIYSKEYEEWFCNNDFESLISFQKSVKCKWRENE